MRQIRRLIQWTTLLFFGIAIYAFTVGQFVPMGFANWRDMHLFYDIILQGLPIMILLTLVWTLNKERQKKTNIAIGMITVCLATGMFFASFFLVFSYGFGAWVDEEIIYENKSNPKVTINRQLWDVGAFGYGGQRIVKLTKVLGLWNWVEKIDTAKIDQDNWTLVQKEGDIKFP